MNEVVEFISPLQFFFQSLDSAHYSDVYKLRAATNGQTKLSDVNNTKHK